MKRIFLSIGAIAMLAIMTFLPAAQLPEPAVVFADGSSSSGCEDPPTFTSADDLFNYTSNVLYSWYYSEADRDCIADKINLDDYESMLLAWYDGMMDPDPGDAAIHTNAFDPNDYPEIADLITADPTPEDLEGYLEDFFMFNWNILDMSEEDCTNDTECSFLAENPTELGNKAIEVYSTAAAVYNAARASYHVNKDLYATKDAALRPPPRGRGQVPLKELQKYRDMSVKLEQINQKLKATLADLNSAINLLDQAAAAGNAGNAATTNAAKIAKYKESMAKSRESETPSSAAKAKIPELEQLFIEYVNLSLQQY